MDLSGPLIAPYENQGTTPPGNDVIQTHSTSLLRLNLEMIQSNNGSQTVLHTPPSEQLLIEPSPTSPLLEQQQYQPQFGLPQQQQFSFANLQQQLANITSPTPISTSDSVQPTQNVESPINPLDIQLTHAASPVQDINQILELEMRLSRLHSIQKNNAENSVIEVETPNLESNNTRFRRVSRFQVSMVQDSNSSSNVTDTISTIIPTNNTNTLSNANRIGGTFAISIGSVSGCRQSDSVMIAQQQGTSSPLGDEENSIAISCTGGASVMQHQQTHVTVTQSMDSGYNIRDHLPITSNG